MTDKKRINLFELGREYDALTELVLLDRGEFTDEHEELRKELEDIVTNKTDKAVEFIYALEDREAAIDRRIAELQASKKTIEGYRKRTSDYFQSFMAQTERQALSGELYQIKRQKPREVVLIDDETKLPLDFIRATYRPDKAKIKAAIKDGVEVDGARMGHGQETLKFSVRPVKGKKESKND